MKYTLIYMSAVWCMNCSTYLETVKRAVVAAASDNCCNIAYATIQEKLPTVVIVDEDYREISRKTGYSSVVNLVEWITVNTAE